MKEALLVALLAVGCASAPSPKTPDDSHRVPVNRVVPPEAKAEGTAKPPPRMERPGAKGVEWR